MLHDADDETIRLRQKLVSDHFPMVKSIARRLHARMPSVTLDDLISDGLYGLTLAGQGFDPSRGIPFGAYARKSVRGEMLRGFKREAKHAERRATVTGEVYRYHDTNFEQYEGNAAEQALSRERSPDELAEIGEGVDFIAAHIGDGPGKQTDGTLKLETLARSLGVSRMTAHVRLRRARELVREVEEMRANPHLSN